MENEQSIVQQPNKVLRQKAKEIPLAQIPTLHIQRLISKMKKTLADTSDGVGLAAPQIGESLRVFIVSDEAEEIDKFERGQRWKQGDTGEWKKGEKPYPMRKWKHYVFVNPTVKNQSRKKIDDAEGCLSVRGIYGIVPRSEKIAVEAYDEHGKKFTRGASRFFARVIQHELDHLDGILFVDKAAERIEHKSHERIINEVGPPLIK